MLISTNKVYYIIKALVACKEHLMILLKGDFSKNAYDLNLFRYENGLKNDYRKIFIRLTKQNNRTKIRW